MKGHWDMDKLPPFNSAALLLDMDGTLIDFAPTPDSVIVPPRLPETLTALRHHLDGALAIVTGRPVETVNKLFGHAPGAIAGEHGGAFRFPGNETIERPELPCPPPEWLEEADALVRSFPGALLERKARGFALHYRLAPEARDVFRAAMEGMVKANPVFQMLPAHMLWEIRPLGADKGGAVRALMQRQPFTGRVPIFIGDDITDEDGMKVARSYGGAGYRVDAVFREPAYVRRWLLQTAERGDWAPFP
jgi:trehalose 6-phosphate phosphatase